MKYIQTKDLPVTDTRGDYPIEHFVAEDEVVFRAGGPGHWYIYWGGGSTLNEGPFPSRRAAERYHRAHRAD